jgi:hypothetical protein
MACTKPLMTDDDQQSFKRAEACQRGVSALRSIPVAASQHCCGKRDPSGRSSKPVYPFSSAYIDARADFLPVVISSRRSEKLRNHGRWGSSVCLDHLSPRAHRRFRQGVKGRRQAGAALAEVGQLVARFASGSSQRSSRQFWALVFLLPQDAIGRANALRR